VSESAGSRRRDRVFDSIGGGEYVRECRMNDKGRYGTSQEARTKAYAVSATRYIYAEAEGTRLPGIKKVMKGLRAVSVGA
jgi:hypothetical protein